MSIDLNFWVAASFGNKRLRTDRGPYKRLLMRGVVQPVESAFDVVVQKLKNIRFPFGDAKVEQTVPII
jgi:hypothetical protein